MARTRRPLIAGNWKMNGMRADGLALAKGVAEGVKQTGWTDREVLICPPATLVLAVAEAAKGSGVMVGGQNCHAKASGACTGDVSAEMLRDAGASHVIVGHSERRAMHGESDRLVAEKAEIALAHGLVPIVCVGETLAEREAAATEDVVARQLGAVTQLLGARVDGVVVAYEPVWAIGTGKTATPAEAQAVHAFLRMRLADAGAASASVRILYGGSVKSDNAAQLFSQTDIDGGLIGGASLKAADFIAICRAAG